MSARSRQPKGQPVGGQFAAEARQESSTSLAPPATVAPTPENTRYTLLVDGEPHAVREPGADRSITILDPEVAASRIVAGDSISLLAAGAPTSTGTNLILRAEVLDGAGRVETFDEVALPAQGHLLVFEHNADYMTVDDLDERGLTMFDATPHDDPLIEFADADERVDLDDVRDGLTASPGDGPYLVDAALDPDDPDTVAVNVCTNTNFLWNDEFTEEELDENRDIVEAVYQEWFNADIDVPDTWEGVDVTIRASIDRQRATKFLILGAAWRPYAKFRNETDPGTYGSPYVGAEIRRRIDAAKTTSLQERFFEDKIATEGR